MAKNRISGDQALLKQVIDPAAWNRIEIENDESWVYYFSDGEINELLDVSGRLVSENTELIKVTKDDFFLPRTAPTFLDIYQELKAGRGFVQMRGLPVNEITRKQIAALFWGIGTYFGAALSQNPEGHLIGHVKDLGKDYRDPEVRGYQTKAAMTFHSDPCDMVALLCLKQSASGGESRVASSITLYNEMLKIRPDLVEDLCKDFYWSKHGEHSPDEEPWYKSPVFNFKDGKFSGKGASTHARKAQNLPGAEPWSAQRNEAVDLFQEMVPKFAVDLPFQEGDLQILNSHVTLHSRRPYEDPDESKQKRHLLRLWLENENLRPVPHIVRQNLKGVILDGFKPCAPLDEKGNT
tara:strand:- start:280 stop:1332 length:1053 start_codon:yes stop_codon:yes gene_type:complete